jgi:glycosyltransferase involved in cell wall biosynthesis
MASPKSSDLAAALAEIRLRGLDRVALVAPGALGPEDLDSLAELSSVAWIGQRGDTAVPDGIRHILFLGSWRALPPALRQRARQLRVTSLLCRVGAAWRHPPTPGHLAKAVYYKALHPVLAPLGRALGRLWPAPARRLRRQAARLAKSGRPGLVLAAGFALTPEEAAALLALPGIAGLVLPPDPDLAGEPRIGFWSNGAWALPEGARQVYVFGRWRAIGRRALVASVDRQLERLALSFGPFWLPVPLGLLAAVLELYRRMPNPLLTTGLFRQALAGAATRPDFVPGRVVLVCGSLAPGGAERQVANTLQGLASRGLGDVRLLCDFLTPDQPARYDFYLPMLRRAGIAVREIVPALQRVDLADQRLPRPFRRAARRMPPNLAADIANLYLEFRALRPEVVHAFLDWSSVRAGMAAALAGVPRIVLSGRNVNPSHFALYQRYMDPVYRILADRPEVSLVNNSEAGARDYEAWLDMRPGQIGVLRNGVGFAGGRAPAERIRALRAGLGVPDGAPLIGGVFRLFPEKRPLLWVEAAAEIAQRRPDAHFVIWGQGLLEAELRRRIAECGLDGRLVLAGMTEDVLTALSALDVFLLTSFKEGTPNVVLEAQHVGTPVVTVEAGGTREALEEGRTGWIVDPPEAAGLAERVCAVLDDAQRRADCLTAGPAFVAARFGLDRMVDETLAAYGFDARLAPRRHAGAA